jgi:hypothetical protein
LVRVEAKAEYNKPIKHIVCTKGIKKVNPENKGKKNLNKPKPPNFNTTAASITEPAVGASA